MRYKFILYIIAEINVLDLAPFNTYIFNNIQSIDVYGELVVPLNNEMINIK